jgi:peptidoglycan/xylan/chitin deacetylase (PgdA/CDA1 family)
MRNAVILTYHSHRVLGNEYAVNDHVALRLDLVSIAATGHRIVPLERIVSALEGRASGHESEGDEPWVAITFDDGPAFDVRDFRHPRLGTQPSFLRIMREFARTPEGRRQDGLCATSFVIASPAARRIMETTFDPQCTYLEPGSMSDDWWGSAARCGLIAIANHSWDHLHSALPEVAHSRQARGDFRKVLCNEDADRQIRDAARYIADRTEGRSVPFFAYPFGHCNAFLADEYLPRARNGGRPLVRAAFTVEPRTVAGGESVWRVPRYVCGQDWKSADELCAILKTGQPGRPAG